MSYRALYEFCQDKAVPVSRSIIQPKACELAGVERVKVFNDTFDRSSLRGYFVSAENKEHRLIKQSGGVPVIVIERGMNRCWTRFVWVKELMHLFDDRLQYVTTGDELASLIGAFNSPDMERSPQLESEVLCFWRAVAVLCPEEKRQDYIQRRGRGEQLTDLAIATELRIPEQYVPRLFNQNYKAIVTHLLAL